MSANRHSLHTHVVPIKVLAAVWLVLLVLTWLTVSATKADLGSLNIVIALAIAAVKCGFVVLYFMHLRYDKPFHAVVFVVALLFVFLFITLALLDTGQYKADLIPGYAPAMEEAASGAAAK
jgi:cytochrome c oxidase subunit 4